MSDNQDRHAKFDRLYKEFYRYSYKVAFNVIHDINQMEDDSSAKAWISTLAHNTAKNILDKKIVRDKKFLNIDDDILYAVTPDSADDPIDIVASKDNIEYIYQQIRTLNKKYSDALLLKHKFKCTPDEIAKLLHTNPKTIYTRLSRGEKMLKEKLLNAERSEKK